MATWLGARELGFLDVACRTLFALNHRSMGPWYMAGSHAFLGLELDSGDNFFAFGASARLRQRSDSVCPSWKRQYEAFHTGALAFSAPHGSEINSVDRSDEVAYARCRLRTDLLAVAADGDGVFIEAEVHANADKLSLAVVDFEGGGSSSVTFSPETGAVLRERKMQEEPRTVEGKYVHLLPAAALGRSFEGTVGLFLCGGRLAFFRRWACPDDPHGHEPWETTGFCTDLRWAQGSRLSVCFAFRDCGPYRVQISSVRRAPPMAPRSCQSLRDEHWMPLPDVDDE